MQQYQKEKQLRLVFAHHSCGRYWLSDQNGGLGMELMKRNIFVGDTNYGWGPDSIGDRTDIGNWWDWFRLERSTSYLAALYSHDGLLSPYTRLTEPQEQENSIIMFKSCYPNSELKGNATDSVPAIEGNPLRGQGCGSEHHTVANAKGIYMGLLEYFKTRPDKLFIAVTAPPVRSTQWEENVRALNVWLVSDWLGQYPLGNVAVFDLYGVLTADGGGLFSSANDDHPSPEGNRKATAAFMEKLEGMLNRWAAL